MIERQAGRWWSTFGALLEKGSAMYKKRIMSIHPDDVKKIRTSALHNMANEIRGLNIDANKIFLASGIAFMECSIISQIGEYGYDPHQPVTHEEAKMYKENVERVFKEVEERFFKSLIENKGKGTVFF